MSSTRKNISSSQNKKALVGISGGVDSSVAAILLKEAGYQVEGVFAKVWQPDFIECTWRDEMKDAMRVCARLDIPFHFLDLEEEYKKHVGDYMIDEYQRGRTPNPDVMCNTHIKFGFIYDFARANGFDYVATGHYAQNIEGNLTRGHDTNKDQSYFLWNVAREKFQHILFPVGGLDKKDVRKIAQKHGLFTAEKKDSQGLCFIGPVDMKSFLKKLIATKKGNVLNRQREIIGEHEGAVLYTIGERHGFVLHPAFKETYEDALFIVSKDIENNTLTVASEAPRTSRVVLGQINMLNDDLEGEVLVQFRYRQKPFKATLVKENGTHVLNLEGSKEFIAPGQSAVLYRDDRCIGGAIVNEVVDMF